MIQLTMLPKNHKSTIKLFQILWLIGGLFYTTSAQAQTYANPDFYLIDSLDLNILDSAEQIHIKSHLTDYHAANSDSTKLNILEIMIEGMRHQVWAEYNHLLYTKARESMNKEGISADLKNHFRRILAGTINNKGYLIGKNGDQYLAVDYYMQANKIFTGVKDSVGMAACYINSAAAYYSAGDLERSNEMETIGLNIGLAAGESKVVSASYASLATKYMTAGFIEEALENGKKSLEYARKIPNERNVELSAMIILAQIYSKMDEDSLAEGYFQEALELSNNYGDIHHFLKLRMTYSEYRLSQIEAQEMGQEFRDSTRQILDEMLNLSSNSASKSVRVTAYIGLGKLYYFEKNYQLALANCDSAYSLSKDMNALFKRKSVRHLRYLVLKKLGRFDEALSMLEEWNDLREQIDDDFISRTLLQNKMKLAYTVEATKDSLEFETKQALATKEIQHQNSQIEADRRQKWILYLGLALIGVISLILLKKFRQTRIQNSLIEDQKSEIEEVHDEMKASIQYAKRLQDALLPSLNAIETAFPENFVLFEPKDIVSGDFYWLEEVEDVIYIAVADCTGHGVPGAMVSVVCNNALNRSLREFGLRSTADILNKTRELVIAAFAKSGQEVKDGMDISLCAIGKKNERLHFSGANNPLWIIRKDKKEIEVLNGNRQPVGLYSKMDDFTVSETDYASGDTLYLFSDGYADQFGGEKGKKLKYKPFKNLLIKNSAKSMRKQEEELRHFLKDWKGEQAQVDDISVIGIRK